MKFIVKALDSSGAVVQLAVDAGSLAQAQRSAALQRLGVVSIRPVHPLARWFTRSRTSFSLELFAQELVSLLQAGLSLVEAIDLLAHKARGRDTVAALNLLCTDLHRGLSLSAALDNQPDLFPALFVASVRAAERTGDIPQALARYLAYHEQLGRVRRKVVSASIYPLTLVGVGGLVGVFMLFYVVPRFSRIYEEIGSQLPWLTRLLVGWGRLLESHAGVTLSGLALAAALSGFALTRPGVRAWMTSRLLALPGLGARLRTFELTRFHRTLGMLLTSGVALPSALEMAAPMLSPLLRGALDRAAHDVRAGLSVSRAFERHGLTTPVSLRLLTVGEQTGRLPQLVERIAQFHEDELARWIDWFTKLFEPALMLLVGALVGLIVVLLYLPIFELAENLQ